MISPRRTLLLFLIVLLQLGVALSQLTNNSCTENEIQFNLCKDDFIPLPNPFETCKDGKWTGSRCFSAKNIVSGNIRFADSTTSGPEVTLNQSDQKNEVGIPQLTTKEWTVDLENFYFVYSVVIYHYIALPKDARRVEVVVETGLQLNSYNKSVTFKHKCEQSTIGLGKRFIFYCFNPLEKHHNLDEETIPGIFSRNVRVSINNRLNQRISISKIQIFENQGLTCGKPVQVQNGIYFPIKEAYSVDSRINYQCNTTENDKKQIESRTCQPNGSWTKIEQSSSKNTTANKCIFQGTYGCPDPDAPSNGVVYFTSIHDKSPKAEFVCNDGYRLSTSGTFRNTACYIFAGVSICQRAYCPYPDEISDTFWVLNNSTTFQGSLVDYYSLEGSNYIRTMECNNDGKWSEILISNDGTLLPPQNIEGDGNSDKVTPSQPHQDTGSDVSKWDTLHTVITVGSVLLVFLLGLLLRSIYLHKKRDKLVRLTRERLLNSGYPERINPEISIEEQVDLLPYDPKWEFPQNRIILGKQLGSGQFGVVFQAKQFSAVIDPIKDNNARTVAIKMIKSTSNSSALKSLASELKILIHLGPHLNVVNLLGACTKGIVNYGELLVILEFCPYGNIHHYLIRIRDSFVNELNENGTDDVAAGRGSESYCVNLGQRQKNQEDNKGSVTILTLTSKSEENLLRDEHKASTLNSNSIAKISSGSDLLSQFKQDTDSQVLLLHDNGYLMTTEDALEEEIMIRNSRRISTRDLMYWSFQIASGMNHLARKKVIHGDLAARNVLLARGNIVKIADFGLSRQTKYNDGTYLKQGEEALPVKWMAPESLTGRIFTTQSDVWAYGVVLWELFTLGKLPYADVTSLRDLIDFLQHGERLEQPTFMPDTMGAIMAQCWESEPKKRPTFSHLETELAKMMGKEVHSHYMKMNPVTI